MLDRQNLFCEAEFFSEAAKAKLPLYLDWAATAPLSREAQGAMAPFLFPGTRNLPYGGNANSLHSTGRFAFAALEDARVDIARCLGAARPDEIIFTSGATEANNSILYGIVAAAVKKAQQRGLKNYSPHIIVSAIEHDAILAPTRLLKAFGCELTIIKPNRQGFVELAALEAALRETTTLVSIQTANNEIASIQPIRELAALAHASGALFHTDAVQALGKMSLNLSVLGVDAASFSAHKIGGPKGIGALYLKAKTPFEALLLGGGQELNKRSGTQNVCGAVGFAAACKAVVSSQEDENARLRALRDYLYACLTSHPKVSPSIEVEAGSCDYLPNMLNVCVQGIESETMILRLDMKGVEVSGGSACSSHSLEPSHVLAAIGLPADRAHTSLRISMGSYTSKSDIEYFIQAFFQCVEGK